MPIEINNPGDYSDPPQRGGLVPFGKYRGKPIEAMLQDPAYCEWFMSQPEMKQKYGNVYQVVINNFGEPSETPESNEMQAKFLSMEFRVQFAMAVNPKFMEFGGEDGLRLAVAYAAKDIQKCKQELKIETAQATYNNQQWEAIGEAIKYQYYGNNNEHVNTHGERFTSSLFPICVQSSPPEFETGGTDVVFSIRSRGFEYTRSEDEFRAYSRQTSGEWNKRRRHDGHYGDMFHSESWQNRLSLRIEIKPQVGDDFPAILRQMRRSRSNVLFTRSYGGIGVDEATFVDYFATQGIRVIFESDVLSQVIPEPFLFDGKEVQKRVVECMQTLNSTKNDQKTN